jgi:hypothetical protein
VPIADLGTVSGLERLEGFSFANWQSAIGNTRMQAN